MECTSIIIWIRNLTLIMCIKELEENYLLLKLRPITPKVLCLLCFLFLTIAMQCGLYQMLPVFAD